MATLIKDLFDLPDCAVVWANGSAPFAVFTMNKCRQNGVQNQVEMLARVFRQEPQHKISILLEQDVLPPVPPICFCAGEMLSAVQLDDNAGLGA
jgi:hypothetical protein